jgi:hypothetical protein
VNQHTSDAKPIIIFDPYPRSKDLIFRPEVWERLRSLGTIISHDEGRMPSELFNRFLPEAAVLIGQTDMPTEQPHTLPDAYTFEHYEPLRKILRN